MRDLVQIAFVFVVGLWLSDGQVAEVPLVTEEPPVTKAGVEPLLNKQTGRTCSYPCLKSVRYLTTRGTWCWFGLCTDLT
uniref:Uncharacterized protein n=1 Tax=Octopus bimaculoides TaxID=37653 RepID=A0A0L8ID70_OCTBM